MGPGRLARDPKACEVGATSVIDDCRLWASGVQCAFVTNVDAYGMLSEDEWMAGLFCQGGQGKMLTRRVPIEQRYCNTYYQPPWFCGMHSKW
jgi:hypothetical protein